jgi:hypothetical protein
MTVNGVLTALVLPFVWMGCVAWFK